ncbi:MAG: hypothetical protein Q8M65_09545, partial [Rhodoglobus sp.]|nr:hypothetical protein [Rhodoglobus sp.]
LAQAGDAGVRIRVDVSQTSQDQTTYSAAGTVSMLAGTNMHHTLFAALEFTGLGVALTWEVLARLGLTSLAGIYRACAQAAVGAGADPAAIEMAVQGAAQEAANAPVEAAAEGGAEVALEGAAAVEATNPVTLPLAIATVLVTLAGELLQKTMFHWLDVYNLTGMDLQLQQPWDDHASFSLALNPLTLAATKTEPDGQTKNVTYGSWMAQNKSGFRGLAYMVYVEPSGTFPGLLATMHVPFAEDNTIALQFKTTSDDWSDWSAVWDKQTRTTSNNLDVTSTNGNFRAILTMNAPSGSEDQFKSTLFIIDTNLFPNFTPRS